MYKLGLLAIKVVEPVTIERQKQKQGVQNNGRLLRLFCFVLSWVFNTIKPLKELPWK